MIADRSKEIFLDVLEAPSARRNELIDDLCGGDLTLHARVKSLLAAHDKAERIIIEPTARVDFIAQSEPPLQAGSAVGPYQIDCVLGEGGFGTVYLAHQQEPVQRRVALKILRPGMDSRDVIRRFELERQALAVMDHPGIARVFDAGATPTGRPYVVMEYVDGKAITEFCDLHQLSIRQRLELFEDVCLAIQHAHGKGVIHRDLKPSNILVSMVDGRPFPKVIDFGIAKAFSEKLSPHHSLTLPQQILGTPQYMAPEQAALDDIDTDTRADVYSLGAILYELLVGTPMFEGARMRGLRPSELERLICEEEPLRPSARVEALDEEKRAKVAAARAIDPPSRLPRALSGDLDWICMRSIEKDRSRRYAAALALAADVRRFLDDKPVDACPPTLSYRVSKFARRHRVEFVAGATIAIALVAFACGAAWFAYKEHQAAEEAKRQLARANALTTFSQDILVGVDPAEARGLDTTLLRKILARSAGKVEAALGHDHESAASMLDAIGYANLQIGDATAAEQRFREALEHVKKIRGPESDAVQQETENLAAALTALNKFDEAEKMLSGQYELRLRVKGPDHADTLRALNNLGSLYTQTGRWPEARKALETLVEKQRALRGPQDESTLTAMNNLANVLDELDELDRAIAMFEQVVKGHIANHGETWPKTLMSMSNLATAYHSAGRLTEARDLGLRVIGLKRTVNGPEHVSTLISMMNLAAVQIDLKDLEAAKKLYEEILEISRRTLPPTDLRIVGALSGLSRIHRMQKHPELAEPLSVEAVQIARKGGTDKLPSFIALLGNLALVRVDNGHAAEAEANAREALQLASQTVGATHEVTLVPTRALARALAAQNRVPEAISALREVLEANPPRKLSADARRDFTNDLIGYLERTGDTASAERWRASLTTQPSDRAK